MKPGLTRIALYSLIALALAGALRFTPPLPEPERKPAEVLVAQAATPSWKLHFDTLGRGESLHALLTRGGLTDDDASRALAAASETSLDEHRIPAGMPVTITSAAGDTIPSEVSLQLSIDKVLRLHRVGDTWTGTEEAVPWSTDTIVVGGTIKSNLYDAMNASASGALPGSAREQLAWSLANVYDYRIDMSRDLQPGDEFKVVAERSVSPNGATKIGKIIAATFKLSGSVIDAVRFATGAGSSDYFDQTGKSLRAAFLRAPLEFRYISSVFGMREHPILGVWKRHTGIDYAAAYGTPVRAIGDGVVIRRGWGNGYGNLLEIRHRNGYVTRYGHLSRYVAGIHVGSHVQIGEKIAYVGATGLATGPHLHFEVLINGQAHDPRVALKNQSGDPIPSSERDAFAQLRDRLLASIDTITGVSKLALQ